MVSIQVLSETANFSTLQSGMWTEQLYSKATGKTSMLLKMDCRDVNKAIRSHHRLAVGSVLLCGAFQWGHNPCYFSAGWHLPWDAGGVEASALPCRRSSAIRLAAKHRETLRAAPKPLLSSPSRKQACGERTVRISVLLVRFHFSGKAVKTCSVLLCKCHPSHRYFMS